MQIEKLIISSLSSKIIIYIRLFQIHVSPLHITFHLLLKRFSTLSIRSTALPIKGVLGCPRTGSRNRFDLVENSTVDFSWHDPLWEKRLKLNSCEYEALTRDRERWNKKAERKEERKKEIKVWNEIERETEKWNTERERERERE